MGYKVVDSAVGLVAMDIDSTVTLSDGYSMPLFGLGVYCSQPGQTTENAVAAALSAGYRLVDTAALYKNERDVGAAIRASGKPREEVYVVTKLWNDAHGYEATVRACNASIERLGVDYIDLYLIHSPKCGKLVETWDAMLQLQKDGLIRSIGVSNFGIECLEGLKASGRPLPTVNQIELSPFLQQIPIVTWCREHSVQVMGYAPLARAKKLGTDVLEAIAKQTGKTAAQVMLRWAVQQEFVTIPKSVHEERICENSLLYDFELTEEDFENMAALDCNFRTCWDPTTEGWHAGDTCGFNRR